MTGSTRDERSAAIARSLIEELVRTSFSLADVLSSLIEDLPDESFPGEDNADVLMRWSPARAAPSLTPQAGRMPRWRPR